MSMFKYRIAKLLIAVAVVGAIAVVGMHRSGDHLVVNQPEQSDLIVVLAGDHDDLRYWHGLGCFVKVMAIGCWWTLRAI